MSDQQIVCRHCGASSYRRHGYTRSHKQRYFCKECNTCFVMESQEIIYDEARKEEILRAYQERASLRGLSRIFGVSRNTITSWIKKSP